MSYMDDFEHLKIPLTYIKAATNNFGDKPIGSGGFGDVYKGELPLPKGAIMVAFKRLNRQFGQGDVEFWKEIIMLSELTHENLATLLHFCNDDKERILVYKYASRGSLDKYLGDASLTWPQRLDICLGAAKGIAYLHDPKKTQQRVLHRDIKSANILLDDKWTPKVSDFGLSKFGPANQAHSYLVSNMVGTPGYCDPSYWETGFLSKECDVYSFGVVLFEVMCGRLCYIHDNAKVTILVYNWRNCFTENRIDDIIFPNLKEQMNHESLSTFSAIANRCLDRDPRKRPHIGEIITELVAAIHQQNSSQCTPYVARAMRVSYNPMEEFQNLKIDLEVIKSATNNFDETKLIGQGGFGEIYKGELSMPEGRRSTVSIKRLNRRYGQGDREFWKEITLLSKIKHENLVSLSGFCDEGGEKIIIYEYASNMSLDHYLSSTSLTWIQRLKICIGAARGLNYLHDPMKTQEGVIHGDIKSEHILLDDNWNAKITDFAMSKLLSSYVPPTYHVGTIGYCDPSYAKTGIPSKESDVFSFGVVLFEVLWGRLCYEYHYGKPIVFLPKWRKSYDDRKLDNIISTDQLKQMDSVSLERFLSIAYQCTTPAQGNRPTMAKVVIELELALELELQV